jgi:hypothetical protein
MPKQTRTYSKPVQNPENKSESIPAKPKLVERESWHVKNVSVAGRLITESYRDGDEEIPLKIQMDENGISEPIFIKDVYERMLKSGFEKA